MENSGNTCVLSVLLQEFAALPHFYDIVLNISLQKDINESEDHFLTRKTLQTDLNRCIHKLRTGELVRNIEVNHLSHLLLQLGWQKETLAPWRRILHDWAPKLFSLPVSNPYTLYEKILALYPEAASSPNAIALEGRISSVSHRELFEQSPFIRNTNNPILWRVAEDPDLEIVPIERLQINQRLFSLKLVHVCLNSAKGNHVVVYRKEGDQWICCNDAHVYAVKALPTTKIYAVVYDSRII